MRVKVNVHNVRIAIPGNEIARYTYTPTHGPYTRAVYLARISVEVT